ncbi:uncharacterized protein LOC120468597 [Pimephales promelas]|uniref:uncharacterized protein LOC120468597 n=1 Tax=Pimephales promelas TaxID=90988 RepID=UPI001955D8BB|nr:uncharacterized protein LOC120468597 [Pimephales promelas]
MAAPGSGTPRSRQDVKKKWHDFSSQVKVRGSAVLRDRARTGAGTSSVQPLTALEEKALAIMGDIVLHGIPGGIDVRRGEQASCSRSSPSPNVPCSPDTEPPAALSWQPRAGRTQTSRSADADETFGRRTSDVADADEAFGRRRRHVWQTQTSRSLRRVHVAKLYLRAYRNAIHRYTTSRRRSTISPCRCSEELVNIEKEKLVVLQDIQRQLTVANELSRQSLELKRAKLELAKQQHALAEAQFNRPQSQYQSCCHLKMLSNSHTSDRVCVCLYAHFH